MSIKLIAQELYRLERETADLEKRLSETPHKEREAVQTIYLPKVLPLVERTPYICDILV